VTHEEACEVATGAPGTIRLGNTVWLVSQPTAADLLALRSYVKARLPSPLEAVAQKVKGLPPEVQAAAVKAAVELEASGSEVTADRIQDELCRPEVAGWWLWMLARKEHPWAKPDDFRAHLDTDNVHAVLADLFAATRMEGVSPNSAPGPSGSTSTVSPGTS
jgi:hypothetical protein